MFWILNMWWARRSTHLPLGRLAVSGLAIVLSFATPVAAVGFIAIRAFETDLAALAAGGAVALCIVTALLFVIPRYRVEILRIVRLARDRNGQTLAK